MTSPRKRTWVLLVPVALLALGSVLGVVALGLERRGLVRLRRVPSPILMGWADEEGRAIAIVNTDSTPGSFLLGFKPNPRLEESRLREGFDEDSSARPTGLETRVWIPARSIVIRTDARFERREGIPWLYGPTRSLGRFEEGTPSHGVPRGSVFLLSWYPYSEQAWNTSLVPDEFYVFGWSERDPFRVVETERVTRSRQNAFETAWYAWDGRARVSVDVDLTSAPELPLFEAIAVRHGESVGRSDRIWAYPPDMSIVDERGR